MAMEDFRVDVVVGKGPGATAIPLEIPPFTLVGATTRAGLLPGPLRDRFGFTAHLEFYEPAELELIVRRSAGLLGRRARPTTAPPRSPRARAARPGSPTGCCAGSATTPRCAPTASSPLDVARRRARPLRGRRVGSRPARPCRPRRAVPPLRRGTGRGSHAGGGGRRGARDRRGGGRAVPGALRPARPDAPRAGRHPGGVGAPRPERTPGRPVRGRGRGRRPLAVRRRSVGSDRTVTCAAAYRRGPSGNGSYTRPSVECNCRCRWDLVGTPRRGGRSLPTDRRRTARGRRPRPRPRTGRPGVRCGRGAATRGVATRPRGVRASRPALTRKG